MPRAGTELAGDREIVSEGGMYSYTESGGRYWVAGDTNGLVLISGTTLTDWSSSISVLNIIINRFFTEVGQPPFNIVFNNLSHVLTK